MVGIEGVLAGKIALMVFPFLMIVAGASDVMTLRIPNTIIIALCGAFGVLSFLAGMPLWLLALQIATASVLLAVGYLLFSFGVFGGGDAKLLAAAGLWMGFPGVLPFLLFSALAGGVLAVGVSLWSMTRIEAGLQSERLGEALAPLSPNVPYGFALAAGAILATPYGWWALVAGQT